ncbi:MAG: alcohol dehydrogenase catalytic domain-containing protein [Chloroflexota bacterium]
MRALFITARKTVEIRETDKPKPAPGEVLLRVRACGICGTDLHFYEGDFPMSPNISPGHEFAGEVAELGEGVTGFTLGDRVAVEPIPRCGACVYCMSGRYHICEKRSLTGTQRPGALAEYIVVPSYTLYHLPDEIDFGLAALTEPLAVCVHGLHIVDVRAGERVLVLGSGTIGLLTTLAAAAAGAEVIATYRHDHQGEAALAVGASRIVRDGETAGLEKQGVDVVVETIGGNAPTLQQALGIVRPGGRISVLGVFTQTQQLNALGLVLKDVRMAGGITYCRPGVRSDFDVALSLLKTHGGRARALITHKFSLDEGAQAFATAADKSTKSLKVQVTP